MAVPNQTVPRVDLVDDAAVAAAEDPSEVLGPVDVNYEVLGLALVDVDFELDDIERELPDDQHGILPCSEHVLTDYADVGDRTLVHREGLDGQLSLAQVARNEAYPTTLSAGHDEVLVALGEELHMSHLLADRHGLVELLRIDVDDPELLLLGGVHQHLRVSRYVERDELHYWNCTDS